MTANVLLSAAAATGVGKGLPLIPAKSRHTVQATMGGTVVATAVTVVLEGSLDNENWFALGTHAFSSAEISAEKAMFHVVDKTAMFVRANLTAMSGGTAPTVTVKYRAEE